MTIPPIIVLDGVTGCGKTSLIEHLRGELAEHNILYVTEDDYTSVSLHGEEFNPLQQCFGKSAKSEDITCTQIYIIQKTAEKLLKTLHSIQTHSYKAIIFDRWIMSCQNFILTKHKLGMISYFTQCFLLHYSTQLFKAILRDTKRCITPHILVIDTPIPTCLQRIKRRHRNGETNTTTWNTFLHTHLDVLKQESTFQTQFTSSEKALDIVRNIIEA